MTDADTTGMDIDGAPSAPAGSSSGATAADVDKKKPRFEIKKYNAVALWAWGTCALAQSCLSFCCGYFVKSALTCQPSCFNYARFPRLVLPGASS
jgi:hypothetical protein